MQLLNKFLGILSLLDKNCLYSFIFYLLNILMLLKIKEIFIKLTRNNLMKIFLNCQLFSY